MDYDVERDSEFKDVVKRASDMYSKKNRDYDNSIDLTYVVMEMLGYPGEVSYVVRSLDKIFRVASLARKSESERKVKDESMLDTLLDEGVYSLAMLRLLEKMNKEGKEKFVADLLIEGKSKIRKRESNVTVE